MKTIVVLLVSSVIALGQSAVTPIVPFTGIDDSVPDDTVLIDQQGRGYVNTKIFNTRLAPGKLEAAIRAYQKPSDVPPAPKCVTGSVNDCAPGEEARWYLLRYPTFIQQILGMKAQASTPPNAGEQIYDSSTPGITPPQLLYAPEPKFPEEVRRANSKGFHAVVVVSLIVDQQGKPQRIAVTQHQGTGLDGAALEAVKRYHFKAAMLDRKPVPVKVNIEVNFQIP
jgi:TonB family protein